MARRIRFSNGLAGVAALVGLILLPLAAAAQQEAGIIGRVTDESTGVLPGVTVTATSPALQLPQVTAVTNELGEYRLAQLPIGVYRVEYSLAGFQTTRREDLRLTVGFTARVDVVMKVNTIEETVTVSGASPLVDVTSSSSSTVLTRETLELIPTSRNSYNAVLEQAPAVRTAIDFGERLTSPPSFDVFGLGGSSSYQTIEGVSNNTFAAGASGVYMDYTSLEEAKVDTIGHSAEMPNPGVFLAVVAKSGSNEFHGNAGYVGTNSRFQSNNIDEELATQGITAGDTVILRDDADASLGGRIIRDKLWFWVGVRNQRDDAGILGCFKPDGSVCNRYQRATYITHKETYQPTPGNRFIGFTVFQDTDDQFETPQGSLKAWESRNRKLGSRGSGKGEWQFAREVFVTSLQAGLWWSNNTGDLLPDTGTPPTLDLVTRQITGHHGFYEDNQNERWHTRGTVNVYKPDWALGNHELRAGFDQYVASSNRVGLSGFYNYQLQTRTGVPSQIEIGNYPVVPTNTGHYFSIWAQDRWTMARRLTLNLGIRYAHDNGFVGEACREAADSPGHIAYPAQCFEKVQPNTWNTVSPRLYATYDLTGSGKMVLKGGWGRFPQWRLSEHLQLVGRNAISTTLYRWRDLNSNLDYDPGEVNLDPNGPDFLSQALRGLTGPLANGVVNPNETQPYTDDYSLQLEWELMPNFAVRALGNYARLRNEYRLDNPLRPYGVYNIPITNRDPGPDGVVATADDPGTLVTYFDFPSQFAGLAFQQPMYVNSPDAGSTLKSFEVAASRRYRDGWTLMASYTATKKDIPFPGSGNQPLPLDPNSEIFVANNTWEWLGRASGSYTLPAQIVVAANFEHRSGNPLARTALFRGGVQIPSITLRVEPLGTSRLPSLNILNLRVEKRFSLGPGKTLAVRVNAFNAMNINTVTSITQQSGASFGRPTAIIKPRIIQLGATYTF
jgi:hypothetical protein